MDVIHLNHRRRHCSRSVVDVVFLLLLALDCPWWWCRGCWLVLLLSWFDVVFAIAAAVVLLLAGIFTSHQCDWVVCCFVLFFRSKVMNCVLLCLPFRRGYENEQQIIIEKANKKQNKTASRARSQKRSNLLCYCQVALVGAIDSIGLCCWWGESVFKA